MLCMNCKFASTGIVITDDEFTKFITKMKESAKSTMSPLIPDPVKDKLAEEVIPFKKKEDLIEHLKKIREDVATRYSHHFYCKKKMAIVVANPDRPTQDIRECEFYVPK